MKSRRTTGHRSLASMLLLIVLLMLAACGGSSNSEDTTPTEVMAEPTTEMAEPTAVRPGPSRAGPDDMEGGMLPEVNPLEVQGDIIAAGSSTVFPLTEAIAERFQEDGYSGQITIDSIGSGAGFERFCVNAETDISNASRAINDEERAACESNGRTPIELRVGTDALAIVVSQENDFAEELTLAQLAQLFSGEAATWADVDPSWPAEEVQLYSPGTDSGTFDYFVEAVYEKDQEPMLSATNIQFSEDDNVLVQGVEGSPYAIGYFGYAYYVENADKLRVLNIEGVEPNEATAESNEYPLSRPLFVYSAPSIIQNKPQVGSFLSYYLANVNDVISDVGYFPASDELLDEARSNLAAALGQ